MAYKPTKYSTTLSVVRGLSLVILSIVSFFFIVGTTSTSVQLRYLFVAPMGILVGVLIIIMSIVKYTKYKKHLESKDPSLTPSQSSQSLLLYANLDSIGRRRIKGPPKRAWGVGRRKLSKSALNNLKLTGHKLTGKLVGIEVHSAGRGWNYYELVVAADIGRGEIKEFTSESLSDGSWVIASQDFADNPISLDIYIDITDPEKYYVDCSGVRIEPPPVTRKVSRQDAISSCVGGIILIAGATALFMDNPVVRGNSLSGSSLLMLCAAIICLLIGTAFVVSGITRLIRSKNLPDSNPSAPQTPNKTQLTGDSEKES
jgi:hypothetical protein